jgi:hypothetical protein
MATKESTAKQKLVYFFRKKLNWLNREERWRPGRT